MRAHLPLPALVVHLVPVHAPLELGLSRVHVLRHLRRLARAQPGRRPAQLPLHRRRLRAPPRRARAVSVRLSPPTRCACVNSSAACIRHERTTREYDTKAAVITVGCMTIYTPCIHTGCVCACRSTVNVKLAPLPSDATRARFDSSLSSLALGTLPQLRQARESNRRTWCSCVMMCKKSPQ